MMTAFSRLTRSVGVFVVAIALPAVLGACASEIRGQTPETEFGPTFADDLATADVALRENYAAAHPRLLFSAADIPAIKKKVAARADLWANVLKHAESLVKWSVPDAKEVSSGAHYWRIEFVQSGALAWLVTGEKKYLDAARNWMVRYCEGKIWGEGWGENVDLHAAWYLYHIGIAYDILRDELAEDDRTLIRDGLAEHAKAIYVNFPERYKPGLTYGQNHLYIPVTGMVAGALAVVDEVPEARDWIKLGYVVMRRARYALGTDGYYFEGFGYWSYALHWHVRYADLMARATGEKLHELPILRQDWLFAMHCMLPGFPWSYDMGDSGRWPDGKRSGSPSVSQHTHLWGIASALRSGTSQLAGNLLDERGPELDYPAATLLWCDPTVAPAALDSVDPYHRFRDFDVVFWRSGWDEGATCLMFRSGPPQGHAAAKKLGVLKDWKMNSGHVHPDIGAFWLYAKGEYLAGDTGYTAEKFTKDHNTLLVSGKGQGADGSYWNDRGISYDRFDKARILGCSLTRDYGYALGEFSSIYPGDLKLKSLRRAVLVTARYLLTVDSMEAGAAQTLTWLCHTDNAFQAEGPAQVSRKEKAGLAVFPLAPEGVVAESEPTIVQAGTGPGKATPSQRGHHLALQTGPAESTSLITLLVPVGANEKLPKVELMSRGEDTREKVRITWPDGTTEDVALDLAWRDGQPGAPVTITATTP